MCWFRGYAVEADLGANPCKRARKCYISRESGHRAKDKQEQSELVFGEGRQHAAVGTIESPRFGDEGAAEPQRGLALAEQEHGPSVAAGTRVWPWLHQSQRSTGGPKPRGERIVERTPGEPR